MTANTENSQPNSQLTLYDSSNSPLVVREADLILTKQESEFVEARLTFSVELEVYQRIDTQALFNLQSDVRIPLTDGDFQPNSDIQISASLKPDLLPLLLEKIPAENLTNTSQQQVPVPLASIAQTKTPSSPIDPLLVTENWLALSVRQIQASKTTGYHTLWFYINPTALFGTNLNSEEIARGIANFFQDAIGNNLDTIAEEFSTQTVAALSNLFSELYIEPSDKEASQESAANSSIFDTTIEFFTQDGWTFFQIENQPALQLEIEATNGRWTCYAAAYEEQQRMVFYSLCPISAPADKRQVLAEFLTRINYGQIIGNFELDMEDGEIRYKTSIDVAGATLTLPQIKSLVYTNITVMDEYLPGILSLINNSSPLLYAIRFPETIPDNFISSKNGQIKDSKQRDATQDNQQELEPSQTLSQLDRETTPPLPSEESEDVQDSDRVETTPPLPSEESEDVQDSDRAETIKEKDQQLDVSRSLPQPDIETTSLSLDVEKSEDIEGEQTVENYPNIDEQLQDTQTLSQPEQENSLPSSPLERSFDVEDNPILENYPDRDEQLQDTQTPYQPDRENSLPPSPLERSSDVEYSPNTENYQDENQQFQDIQTPSKIERINSHLFSVSELYEVARKPSQPLQDNTLTTTLTEQVDPTQQPERFSLNPDILSDLTEEETASFELAIQLIKTGKINASKTILAAIKNNMTGELGEEGEQIFYTANNLFLVTNLPPASINQLNGYDKILPPNVQNIIPVLINPKLECNSIKIDYEFSADGLVSQIYAQVGAKTVAKELKPYFGTLKQIYRYWDISSQLKPLLEHMKNIGSDRLKQSSQTTRDTLRASERLPACIQTRLLQLAAEKLESQLEVDILIEVGELQELLAKTKRILNMEFLCDPAQAAADRKTIGSEGRSC